MVKLSAVPLVLLVFCLPSLARSQVVPEDAYLDAAAATMVAGARAQEAAAEALIEAYEMTARERISVGLQASQRDRLLYRRETVARVTWAKEGGWRSEILGAREVAPVVDRSPRPVRDRALASAVNESRYYPLGGWLLGVPGGDDEENGSIIHPLAADGEQHYRFRSGDMTTIRLPDGRVIRLVELQVIPRRAAANLLSGSFWLDLDTNAPVRGIFSLASPMRWSPSAGFIPLPLPDAAFTIRYLTVDYGLWESRWWMHRLVSFEGNAMIGGITVPMTLERSFEDYRFYTAENPWGGFEAVDTTRYRTARLCSEDSDDCTMHLVVLPRDTAALLSGPDLPRSIFSRGGRLMSDRELEELTGFMDASRWRGMFDRSPSFDWDPLDGSLMHYNRVEGLTLGTSASAALAPLSASAALWIGLADRSPSFEVGIGRSRVRGEERVTVYRRIDAFSPRGRPFSLGNSFSAFAFGRDEGDYFRVLGARLSSVQSVTMGSALTLGAYVERHSAESKNTDASIPHWRNDRELRANPAAEEADQVGIDVRAVVSRGLDPAGFRGGFELGVQAETGTYRHARPSAGIFTTFPLPGRLLGALEGTVGTAFGDLPVQREWYVGGRGSVRGIAIEERVSGAAFWTGRAEIATERPAARIVLFGDAGWAGRRADFTTDPLLLSAGVGMSYLDGLLRIDVARALRGGTGWALQLSADAPL